jgi:outer membrane protein assembly factor BamB
MFHQRASHLEPERGAQNEVNLQTPMVATLIAAVLGIVALGEMQTTARAADWPTFDGNPARAAWLNSDRSINRKNVGRLKRKWVTTLDAVADSTPIYMHRVTRGSTRIPMLFQTDGVGTTYGIDASSGTILWRFKTTGPKITASTPVMDPSGTALYVPGVDGYVHKVDAASGNELSAPGFPAQITLIPNTEKDASPLTLANGFLYAATSGYLGDAPPYQGHVVTVNLSNGTTNVFNSLCANLHMLLTGSECSSERSGIWARAGVVVDPDTSMDGQVYFATGNGPYKQKLYDYGDSTIALTADGSNLTDWFTPPDRKRLWEQDLDLGSTAPAMLPPAMGSSTPLLAVQGGKGQVLYLLDRTHLGGIGGQLQGIPIPTLLYTAPSVWVDEHGKTMIYIGFLPGSTEVWALTLGTDNQGRSRLHKVWTSTVSGTSPVTMGGVVILAKSNLVTALDSRNGAKLWASDMPGVGGTIGPLHWQSPIAVDGGVYISDRNQILSAYTIDGM